MLRLNAGDKAELPQVDRNNGLPACGTAARRIQDGAVAAQGYGAVVRIRRKGNVGARKIGAHKGMPLFR